MNDANSPAFEILTAVLAAVLFIPLFIFRSFGALDFWAWMSLNLAVLLAVSGWWERAKIKAVLSGIPSRFGWKILGGLASAAALYAVFYGGNALSRAILPFAGRGIGNVYAFKAGVSPLRIAALIGLLIGPGEELFWRGFLQRRWQTRFGKSGGFVLASALYTLVHAGSGNPMLVLAAAVCGVFWGFLYLRTGSLLLVAVSHTAWDLAAFLVFPFPS